MVTRTLVVKVTCAEDAPERASQAFTVAASAAAAGAPVSLWLTGEASWWAVPGRGPDLGLEHATPVEDLLAGLDPAAEHVEVHTSHCGMAVDPEVVDVVVQALRAGVSRPATRSAARPA